MGMNFVLRDVEETGVISSGNDTFEFECQNISGAKAVISGTWIGVVKFEQTIDNVRWDNVGVFSGTTGAILAGTGLSSNDIVVFVGIAGALKLRAKFSSYTSGSANIKFRSSIGISNVFANNLIPGNLKTQSYLNDGVGNAITSQLSGVQRALDIGINVNGNQIDPRNIIGGTTNAIIGNTGDRLKVDANLTSVSTGALSQYPNKLRHLDINASNGGIARRTTITSSSWVDAFSYSGSGSMISFFLNLEYNNGWLIRLLIDGEDVFGSNGVLTDDFTSTSIYNMTGNDELALHNSIGLYYKSNGNFIWTSPLNTPTRYNDSVVIKLKRNSGELNKKFQAGLVSLTKET